MDNKEFDTSELLSSLEKLKAKYSFNLDDEKPQETPAPAVEEPAIKETPVIEEEPIQEIAPEVEEEPVVVVPPSNDMSWLIDSDDSSDAKEEPQPVEEEPQPVEEEVPVEETVEAEPVTEVTDNSWFITPPEETEETEEVEPEEAEPVVEEIPVTDKDDEFSDLDDDDDLVVIRHNEPKEEEKSPFYAAFAAAADEEENNKKPPKPVKSQKPAKAPKEPKKAKGNKKSNKKVILNVVVAVVLAVALWACVFVTDIVLVSNWYSPLFCVESESYSDGSKTYTGAFYQIQVSSDENGNVERVCLPWFVEGPNGNK